MNENYKNDENLSTRYTIWFMKRKIDIEYAYCLIVTKRKKKFSWAARNNVYNDGEIEWKFFCQQVFFRRNKN